MQTASGLLHVVDKVLIAGQGAVDPPRRPPRRGAAAAATGAGKTLGRREPTAA